MLAVQGPRGARARRRARPTASCRARFRTAELTVAGVAGRARVRHRLHGRGRRRAAGRRRDAAGAVWDAVVAAGATPVGLGARDTLRLEACFHLYGNDLSEDRNPIEAGLGWCCKEATGFIGAEPIARRAREGTAEKLVPFAITGPGHRAPGQPGDRRRRRHVRHALADARLRDRARLPAGGAHRSRVPRSRSTCAARPAPPKSAASH